jgi:hypothetical protein
MPEQILVSVAEEPGIKIGHRYTGEVLFTAKGATTVAAAVVMAVAAGANLSGANLSGANLSGANLSGANLSGANLIGANLNRANLNRANLIGANLIGANLYGASLYRANLIGANLDGANLDGANLYGASLYRANLIGANLDGANLIGASLIGANLIGASLENVKGLAYQIPQEGELIVWKAVKGGVCKLRIPPEAKRTATPIGRKCRAEWVEVLEAPEDGRGLHDSNVIYHAGEVVRPDKYDPDPRVECAHGIHFFLTREEAENYQ